jgi:hypothetical protein
LLTHVCIIGYLHAFFASLTPFAAEEIGVEVSIVVEEYRKSKQWPQIKNAYAFRLSEWLWYINGTEHVKFSGGSYVNHGRFACWASGQFLVGGAASILHAFFPCFLPHVGEEQAFELGSLIRNRRLLRNASKDHSFVNPDNLNDWHSDEFKAKFKAAEKRVSPKGKRANVVDFDEKRIPVQLVAGQDAKLLVESTGWKRYTPETANVEELKD